MALVSAAVSVYGRTYEAEMRARYPQISIGNTGSLKVTEDRYNQGYGAKLALRGRHFPGQRFSMNYGDVSVSVTAPADGMSAKDVGAEVVRQLKAHTRFVPLAVGAPRMATVSLPGMFY